MSFGHPDCYARVLGGCSTELSREHWTPECMLRIVNERSKSILTRHQSFQKGEDLQEVGLGSLCSKILCTTHNSQLHRFDTAGCITLEALDQMNATAGDRSGASKLFTANGDDLERCMLKMLVGGAYSGALPIRGQSLKGVPPPREWLDSLYAGRPFGRGHGLWIGCGQPGQSFQTRPEMLRVLVIQAADDRVIGLRLWMLEVEFTLVLADIPDPCPDLEHAHYRPAGISIDGCAVRLKLEWKEAGTCEGVCFMLAGLAKPEE